MPKSTPEKIAKLITEDIGIDEIVAHASEPDDLTIVQLDPEDHEPKVEDPVSETLSRLLYLLDQCVNYANLYGLEDEFNECGLTIQSSTRDRMVLCKIQNGKPSTGKCLEDYMFLGNFSDKGNEISDRACERICNFVQNSAGMPGKIQDMARAWRNGVRLYGHHLALEHEEQNFIACIME